MKMDEPGVPPQLQMPGKKSKIPGRRFLHGGMPYSAENWGNLGGDGATRKPRSTGQMLEKGSCFLVKLEQIQHLRISC